MYIGHFTMGKEQSICSD